MACHRAEQAEVEGLVGRTRVTMRKGSGGSNRLVRYFLIKLPVFSLACSLEEGGTVHLLLDSGSGDIAKSKNGSPLPEREAGSFFWDVLRDASLCSH